MLLTQDTDTGSLPPGFGATTSSEDEFSEAGATVGSPTPAMAISFSNGEQRDRENSASSGRKASNDKSRERKSKSSTSKAEKKVRFDRGSDE